MFLSLEMPSDCAVNTFPEHMLQRPAQQAIQIFQIARFGALLVVSIILSKSQLSTAYIGIYETMLLITGTLSFFWINGTTHTFLSRFKKSSTPEQEIQSLFGAVTLLSLIIGLLLFVTRRIWADIYAIDLQLSVSLLFIVYFVCNNFSFLADYILLARENGKGLMLLSLFQFIFQVAAIAVPAFLYHDLTSVLLGAIVFVATKALISLYIIAGDTGLRFSMRQVRQFLTHAYPLMISFFLGGISIYVDGLIINRYFDKQTFAVYQYGAREFPISLLLANAFSAAMVVHISAHLTDYQTVKDGTQKLIRRMFPLVLILMGISYWAYPLVYNPQFQESYLFFNIYLLLIASRLVFPHSILLGMGHSKLIMQASIVEFFMNIIVSMFLLQWIGISGVAYGTVVAHITNKIILMYQLRKKGVALSAYIPVRLLSIYTVLLLAVFITFTYLIH